MLGLGVLMPMSEHGRYDLAIEIGRRILRVQCKWARKCGDVIKIGLATSRHTPLNGYLRSRYTAGEVDAVAAYCGELDRCYFFPIGLVEGRSALALRLAPARNGQRAAVNFACDYEFAGAVAQLEEHLHGMEGVVGSNPISSIGDIEGEVTTVGAEEFGLHPSRFLQRAASGERFLVTRRGRAMARVLPPDPGASGKAVSDELPLALRPQIETG